MHKDEGYMNSKEWTPNLHAHIVFDWTQNTGKSCKLYKPDMSEMQGVLAECLGMERGISSDKKHLSAVQYKIQQEEERISKLEAERRAKELKFIEEEQRNKRAETQRMQSEKEVAEVQTKKNILVKEVTALKKTKQSINTGIRIKQAILKTAERFKDFLGISVNDKEKIRLITEKNALVSQNTALSRQVETLEQEVRSIRNRNAELQQTNSKLLELQQNYTTLKIELGNFIQHFANEDKSMNIIREKYPRIYKAYEQGLKLLRIQQPVHSKNRGIRM
jgi:myosin heavy subunit